MTVGFGEKSSAVIDRRYRLLADNLYQDAFLPAAIEFAVEDLFPRAEIELAFRNRDNNFATHDLAFQVRIRVVFAGAIVAIGGSRRVRRQFLQPQLVVMMQARFVVVDEDRGGNMHGVDETKTFPDAALGDQLLDPGRDVDEPTPGWHFEPEMLGQRFQVCRRYTVVAES